MSNGSKNFDWPALIHGETCLKLAQLANRSFGVNLNFVDNKGWLKGVPAGRFFNPANRLSTLISISDEGFKSKRDTAFQLASEVSKIRQPKRSQTSLGTGLVAVPILVDGEYIGYVYADDFFESENITEQRIRFESYLRRHFQNEPEMLEQVDEIPVLSSSDVNFLVDLMEVVAETFGGDVEVPVEGEKRTEQTSPTVQIDGFSNPYIVGRSKATQDLIEMLARVAGSDATVLVIGESGVGKELVAKTLHENSKRKKKDYIAVNCGAFHEHLLESELFGHVKGAFTGATENRIGYFERAHGGSLFLDEIGETTPATQVKMLRFLQESTFIPVGSSNESSSNVRVIAATNRDLKQMLKKGKFREDLYYRLKVIQLNVPSLRERKEDIPVLVDFFLGKHAMPDGVAKLTEKTNEIINQYYWPGNIRQLENEIKRLVVLGRDDAEIGVEHLSPEILKDSKKKKELYQIDDRLKKTLEDRERKLIVDGLRKTGGNKSKLARDLGMSRTVLANKIKKYEIDTEEILKKSS